MVGIECWEHLVAKMVTKVKMIRSSNENLKSEENSKIGKEFTLSSFLNN